MLYPAPLRDFLMHLKLLEQDAQRVHLAAERQRTSLKNPPKTQSEYGDIMEAQGLPQTVQKLREAAE